MKNYSIENLLVGAFYRSSNRYPLEGFINYAEKRGEIWVGSDADAYSVRFRVEGSIKEHWATVSVSHAD